MIDIIVPQSLGADLPGLRSFPNALTTTLLNNRLSDALPALNMRLSALALGTLLIGMPVFAMAAVGGTPMAGEVADADIADAAGGDGGPTLVTGDLMYRTSGVNPATLQLNEQATLNRSFFDFSTLKIARQRIQDGAINGSAIVNGSVNASLVDGDSIAGMLTRGDGETDLSQLAVGEGITSEKIRNNDITFSGNALAANSIDDAADIADNAVYGDLFQDQFTGRTIKNNALLARTFATNAINASKIANGTVGSDDLADDSVNGASLNISLASLGDGIFGGAQVEDDAVNATHFAEGSIGSAQLEDGIFTADDLDDGAVEATHFDSTAGNVGSAQVAQVGTIDGSKIEDGGIEADDLADGAISSLHIADRSITSVKIAENSVLTAHLADGSVNGTHIVDGSITSDAILANAVGEELFLSGAVASRHITSVSEEDFATGTIESAHIRDGEVTSAVIEDGALTAVEIADDAVQSRHIATDAVSSTKILADAITSRVIAENAIGSDQIQDRSLTGMDLEFDVLTSLHIAEGGVGSLELQDGVVSEAKLDVDVLYASGSGARRASSGAKQLDAMAAVITNGGLTASDGRLLVALDAGDQVQLMRAMELFGQGVLPIEDEAFVAGLSEAALTAVRSVFSAGGIALREIGNRTDIADGSSESAFRASTARGQANYLAWTVGTGRDLESSATGTLIQRADWAAEQIEALAQRDEDLEAGIAMAAAPSSTYVEVGRRGGMDLSFASFGGSQAVALGIGTRIGRSWQLSGSVASDSDFSDYLVRFGVNFQW